MFHTRLYLLSGAPTLFFVDAPRKIDGESRNTSTARFFRTFSQVKESECSPRQLGPIYNA
jgi:hypothetical protein